MDTDNIHFKDQNILKAKYQNIFKDYPDVVDMRTICKMLGGVSDGYIRRRLQNGTIRSFFIYDGYAYMTPKTWVIDFLMSPEYQDSKRKLKYQI